MFQTDKFLGIFTLETGGQFLGWLGIITNGLILPASVILLIVICNDKEMQLLHANLDEDNLEFLKTYDEKHLRDLLICTLVLTIIFSSIYLLVCYLLVRGVRNVSQIAFLVNLFRYFFKNLPAKPSAGPTSQERAWGPCCHRRPQSSAALHS